MSLAQNWCLKSLTILSTHALVTYSLQSEANNSSNHIRESNLRIYSSCSWKTIKETSKLTASGQMKWFLLHSVTIMQFLLYYFFIMAQIVTHVTGLLSMYGQLKLS